MPARGVKSPVASKKNEALGREILERVADKWTLLAIDALEGKKEVRFSGLRERIGGVSQKMLTKTLRQLERDGLVTRRVHAEVPPRDCGRLD
jgi:DNA-binding HxlR family transcriptional regulator